MLQDDTGQAQAATGAKWNVKPRPASLSAAKQLLAGADSQLHLELAHFAGGHGA